MCEKGAKESRAEAHLERGREVDGLVVPDDFPLTPDDNGLQLQISRGRHGGAKRPTCRDMFISAEISRTVNLAIPSIANVAGDAHGVIRLFSDLGNNSTISTTVGDGSADVLGSVAVHRFIWQNGIRGHL